MDDVELRRWAIEVAARTPHADLIETARAIVAFVSPAPVAPVVAGRRKPTKKINVSLEERARRAARARILNASGRISRRVNIDMAKVSSMQESGVSTPEIAKTLGVAVSTLYDRLARHRAANGHVQQ